MGVETKKILMETLRGRCYCGTIEFEVRATKPVLSIYCHCSDCRRAHGAPVYQMFLVQSSEFSVTKGHDSVKHNWMKPVWAETKCCSRSYCAECGSRVWNVSRVEKQFSELMPCGEYHGVLPGNLTMTLPDAFKPTMHLFCSEAIVDLSKWDDGLPKFPKGPQ